MDGKKKQSQYNDELVLPFQNKVNVFIKETRK